MVPLFVGYALIVWYATGKHRRQVAGALVVLAGLLGLVFLNWLHIMMGRWSEGEIFVPVLQTLTYPYSAFVVFVGCFIWAIPNHAPDACTKCRYDLKGHAADRGVIICPECGMRNTTRGAYRPSGADRSSFDGSDDRSNTAPGFKHSRRLARGPVAHEQGTAPRVMRAAAVRSSAEEPPAGTHDEHERGEPADDRPAQDHEPVL